MTVDEAASLACAAVRVLEITDSAYVVVALSMGSIVT